MKRIVLLVIFCSSLQFIFPQHSHEQDTLHQEDGATHQEDSHSHEGGADEAITPELPEGDKNVQVGFDAFPNLHPLVVHFPIVLLLLGGFLQLIHLFVLKRNLDWVILLCAGAGFIGAYIAGVYAHPHAHELSETAKQVLAKHDLYAEWTIYASALAAVLKLVSLFFYKQKRGFEIAVFVVMGIAAYSVAEAGHFGSQLVYIEGVGPQGDYLEPEGEHTH